MSGRQVVALAVAALLLKACVPGAVTGESESAPGATTGENMELQQVVGAATRHLADRLGVPESEITVAEASRVTWRDSSLGCPAPGMSYLQMLTPGFLVRLRAAGTVHAYHAGPGGEVFSCPASRAQPPLPGSSATLETR